MPSNHLILCYPLSSCLQSFPASGSFQMSQLFASGGQSFGNSASTSVLPMNTLDWSLLGWTVITELQSHVQLFATPWTVALQPSLTFSISRSLLKFMSIESVMLLNYLILHHRLLCNKFTLDGQNFGVSVSVNPMNIQGWFSLGLIGLILQSLSKVCVCVCVCVCGTVVKNLPINAGDDG